MSDIHTKGHVLITGQIRLKSGLHIGAGKDSVEIGGIDNPVLKHPHTGEPYIPGSSIKGKLRFLMEWGLGKIRSDGQAWGFNDQLQTVKADDPILRIFGNALKNWDGGPTRLMVRDCPLSETARERYLARPDTFFEEKTEVLIDRISGKARDGVGPRFTERVPAGVDFDFELVFRLYDTGDLGERDVACLNWTLQGLALLEQDALGGSGSRGYGRFEFINLRLNRPGADAIALDNRFRGHPFSSDAAQPILGAGDIFGVSA